MQPYQHCQEWHQSPKVETVSLPSWRYISAFRTQGQRRKKATTNHPKSLSRTHEPTWLTRVLESITQSIQFDHKILPFNPATYRWFFWCLQVEVMGSSCHEYTQTLVVGQTWISPLIAAWQAIKKLPAPIVAVMTSEKPVLALWESNLTIATMLNVQPCWLTAAKRLELRIR